MPNTRTVDVHTHILEADTIRLLQAEVPKAGFKLSSFGGEVGMLEFGGRSVSGIPRGAWDVEARVRDMDATGIDMQILSICTFTSCYWLDSDLALAVAQIQNEQIAALVKRTPHRFVGLGTVPMQAPERAADELRRGMRTLGLRGIQIGSNVNGRNLDDPALEPIWETAAELGAFILVHPFNAAGVPGLDSYYLRNLIGNPLDTTIAAASLVFGGVLERHPSLTFCMVHGGGFAPYQVGRFFHGWQVRDEAKVNLKRPPRASFDRLYFDTVLHDPKPLGFLLDLVGSSRVLLGTDYPFDMGQYNLGLIDAVQLSEAEKNNVFHANALRLTGASA